MEAEKLKEILEKHALWLRDEESGEKANLSYADLSGADLSGANLSYANLSSADLSSADLSGANLSYANLSYADLSGADLSGANLSYANLSSADLRSANLSSAKSGEERVLKAYSFTGFGSQRRMTTFLITTQEVLVWCGCFNGDLEHFEKRVVEQCETETLRHVEYVSMIEMVKKLTVEARKEAECELNCT